MKQTGVEGSINKVKMKHIGAQMKTVEAGI